tara:strand:+ start:1868 stop:2386 length:519 start_codon:yes stop_codon:yes gene_type:complete
MKLYFKLFLLFGTGYGLVRGIKAGSEEGLIAGITTGIIEGLFFGLVMSFFIGKWQKRKIKKMQSKPGEEIGPSQSKSILIEESQENAFNKSIEALKIIKAKVKYSDIRKGLINGTTGISWKSFGEKIYIKIIQKPENKVEITITSKPLFPLTLVDYGKGRENVTSFVNAIKS